MARKEFAGGFRLWINGTLYGDALNIEYTRGGAMTRIITSGGNSGEVRSDPNMVKISVQHAVPKNDTQIQKIAQFAENSTDITLKVQIGNMKRTAIGKISTEKLSAAPGKGEYSFEFEGDAQSVGV